jgi:hypothetical protein
LAAQVAAEVAAQMAVVLRKNVKIFSDPYLASQEESKRKLRHSQKQQMILALRTTYAT